MKTVKESWDGYLHNVVPKTAGPVQIMESRSAFYAGALVVLGLSLEAANIEDIDEAEKAYSKINDEVMTFAQEMIK